MALRGLPRYHLEYAGSLPFRRAFLPDGRDIEHRSSRALNQGYAITGFPGLIYWPILTDGRSSVVVLVGDLPRCGAGGTRSHVIRTGAVSVSCDPALWTTLGARTPPSEFGWRRPTVADTIAKGASACQAQLWVLLRRVTLARLGRWALAIRGSRAQREARGMRESCGGRGLRISMTARITEPTRKPVHPMTIHSGIGFPTGRPISHIWKSRIAAIPTRIATGGARNRIHASRQLSRSLDGYRSHATTLIAAMKPANSIRQRIGKG